VRTSSASSLLLGALLGACASARPPIPPERPLFRLESTAIAEGASSKPTARLASAPLASPVKTWSDVAYQTSVRIVRPDGTVLTAPRLTAYAGQRADMQIVNQTAFIQDFDVETVEGSLVADPIIGVLNEGSFLQFVVLPVAGHGDEAAVGLRLTSTAARKPIDTREVELLGSGSERRPVTIQMPRTEDVSVAGAQRVRLGVESEWASLPDPAGGADLRILGRVDVVDVAGIDDLRSGEQIRDEESAVFLGEPARAARAPSTAPEADVNAAALRGLADLAAAGAPQGVLRITAVRMPPRVSDLDASGVVRLGELSVRTVLGDAVRVANLLNEPYVADWRALELSSLSWDWSDPVIGAALTGLAAEGAPDGCLRLQWTTLWGWDHFSSTTAQGRPAAIDLPDSRTATVVVAPSPGRTVHPMFTLPDGDTAAVVVEFTPDAAR